ncbi:MAG: type III-B CRISPR module-associated protein Cmr3 [Anaerolineaceae bacterium]|nr:type III-B CRISPR module-associated protein Cmr3 [Anaerolineaceae bacterium]
MKWLWLKASDVWLFRTGHPFNAGQNDTARSLFPPSPLTVAGALRGAVIQKNGISWQDYSQATEDSEIVRLVGKRGLGNVGDFAMQGPFIACYEPETNLFYRYFPTPSDIVSPEILDGESPQTKTDTIILHPEEKSNFYSSMELQPLNADVDVEPHPGTWIREDVFTNYLQGIPPQYDRLVKSESLYTSEYRFGIGMDYRLGTVNREEGLLYQAEFIRPQPQIGLLVRIADIITENLGTEGAFSLGGERHTANFKLLEDSEVYTPPTFEPGGQFKVIVLTPSYFTGGWQPADWSSLLNGDVTLMSAVVDRPQKIGGWDASAGEPRTMHHFVKPGSVYYFQGSPNINGESITENPPDFGENVAAALGFGQFALGRWTY